MKKYSFSLLEIMVAICLLMLTVGALGWKMQGMIVKKRFTANTQKLHSRFLTCRRLALNMQADWQGVLQLEGEKWVFYARCVENPKTQALPPLSLDSLSLSFNGEKQESVTFEFASSGEVFPRGILSMFDQKSNIVEWQLPAMFLYSEGIKPGPIHPDDLNVKVQGI